MQVPEMNLAENQLSMSPADGDVLLIHLSGE
jgi:hypothetical protein